MLWKLSIERAKENPAARWSWHVLSWIKWENLREKMEQVWKKNFLLLFRKCFCCQLTSMRKFSNMTKDITPSFFSSPFIRRIWLFLISMRLGPSQPSMLSVTQPISLHLPLSLSTDGNHRSPRHLNQTCAGWAVGLIYLPLWLCFILHYLALEFTPPLCGPGTQNNRS